EQFRWRVSTLCHDPLAQHVAGRLVPLVADTVQVKPDKKVTHFALTSPQDAPGLDWSHRIGTPFQSKVIALRTSLPISSASSFGTLMTISSWTYSLRYGRNSSGNRRSASFMISVAAPWPMRAGAWVYARCGSHRILRPNPLSSSCPAEPMARTWDFHCSSRGYWRCICRKKVSTFSGSNPL